MPDDRFRPDASLRRIAPIPTSSARKDGAAYFDDDRGPIGNVGRHSIPKSHRAEGRNFVD